MNWTWAQPSWGHALWLVPLAAAGLLALEARHRRAQAEFLSATMAPRLLRTTSHGRRIARTLLIASAMAAAVVALMRPQAQGVASINGGRAIADVMFVLDVSKSMLADDAAPNRLARAKAEITQVVRGLGAHRFGLVAFAGRAALLCPLTPDQEYFGLALRAADPSAIGKGGTRIGDAIRTALRGFPPGEGGKLIVLITDGEDHESMPEAAAKAAAEQGVHIVAVGIGSTEGTPLTITDPATGQRTEIMHEGKPVISKLDQATLESMASLTDGAYVPAGTGTLDIDSILTAHVTPMLRADATQTRALPAERYPGFLLVALLALGLSLAVAAPRQKGTPL